MMYVLNKCMFGNFSNLCMPRPPSIRGHWWSLPGETRHTLALGLSIQRQQTVGVSGRRCCHFHNFVWEFLAMFRFQLSLFQLKTMFFNHHPHSPPRAPWGWYDRLSVLVAQLVERRPGWPICSQKECPTKFETRWLQEIPFSKELTDNYCALRLQLRV